MYAKNRTAHAECSTARLTPSLHPHHDQFGIVIYPHGRDAVAEAAAYDELHAGVVGYAFVRLGEPLEFGRDQAAQARDDDLAAVVVAGEDEVGAEVLVELVVLWFVREHDDGLVFAEGAVSLVSSVCAIGSQRSICYTREHIIRSLNISVIQKDYAELLHLFIERVKFFAGQTHLVVAANIINRRYPDRAFDEVERDLIRRVGRVDDVAGNDDDVG